jgi:protein ImuB
MLDALIVTQAQPVSSSATASSASNSSNPASSSLAVVDLERGAQVVCACNASAARCGIAAGMALNAALALVPELQPLTREPRRERALLESIATLALERFTPRVSLEPPDAVLLEIRGSLQLHGGVRALCERLRAELETRGVHAQLAVTPTALASLWFARAGQPVALRRVEQLRSRLSVLPLESTTRWASEHLELLATMGVRSIGDCLRLPRDGFARRFAPGMLELLDRATGRLPDTRRNFRAAERFSARRDLEPEIHDAERLERALEPMLGELARFLRQCARGLQTLELQLEHRDELRTRLRLRFMQPVARWERIAPMLHERLAQLQLSAPVRAVRLRSGPLLEIAESPDELFARDARGSSTMVSQLIERLRARLGVEAVHGVRLVAEHRPESAWRVADIDITPAERRSRTGKPAREAAIESPRPLWLLTEPQPLEGIEHPHCEGPLEIEDGPERIETGWWDGRDVTRDYYVARNAGGVRLWIYRERGRARGKSRHRWFLHGVFG